MTHPERPRRPSALCQLALQIDATVLDAAEVAGLEIAVMKEPLESRRRGTGEASPARCARPTATSPMLELAGARVRSECSTPAMKCKSV